MAAQPLTDTIKESTDGFTILKTLPRSRLWAVQTPQAFRRELLLSAHRRASEEQITVTDDAYLCERFGVPVQVVRGSSLNLKITTPDDLEVAETIAVSRRKVAE